MRMLRLLAAVTALVMAASLSALVSSSATAAPASHHLSKPAAAARTAVDAKAARPPHRMKSVRAVEIRDSGKFLALGKISTLRNKKIILKKAADRRSPFRSFKTGRTNGRGQFRIGFDGRVGNCFQVVAPPTPRNRSNAKVVGCIVRGG